MTEKYCSHAYLDPRLGIPIPIIKLINLIHQHIETPGF